MLYCNDSSIGFDENTCINHLSYFHCSCWRWPKQQLAASCRTVGRGYGMSRLEEAFIWRHFMGCRGLKSEWFSILESSVSPSRPVKWARVRTTRATCQWDSGSPKAISRYRWSILVVSNDHFSKQTTLFELFTSCVGASSFLAQRCRCPLLLFYPSPSWKLEEWQKGR